MTESRVQPTESQETRPQSLGSWRLVALRATMVAGGFSLLLGLLMVGDYFRRSAKDPLEARQFKALKAELVERPKDDELKYKIRILDLQLRETYFKQRSRASLGAWMLLGGLAVMLVAWRSAITLQRKLPLPQHRSSTDDPEIRTVGVARWAVAVLAAALVLSAISLRVSFSSALPPTEALSLAATPEVEDNGANAASEQVADNAPPVPAKPEPPEPIQPESLNPEPAPTAKPPAAAGKQIASSAAPAVASAAPAVGAPAKAAPRPTGDPMLSNWPRFRGPGGLGISNETAVPTSWDAKSGKNIVWKSPVALPGNSSPVVWNDRLFLTGADEKTRKVFCFNLADGKLLWDCVVPGTPQSAGEVKVSDDTGLAASTAATDGQRVYAIFANGDLAAIDYGGKVAWSRSLGIPKNDYGHASSLITYKNLLIVQFDQGATKEKLSKIYALDSASGKRVWDVDHPVPSCWTTPIIFRHAGVDQLVATGDPWVIAYRPEDGKEIWRTKSLRQDVGPSPTFANGIVYAANEFPCLSAIRADGQGDVTETHVLWKGEDGLPDTCTPLATEKFVLLLSSSGTLTCYEAKKGEKLWEKDFESSFKASPTLVGTRLYLIGDEGKAWVVEPDLKECKDLAEADLNGEKCTATPAFHAGRIYLRGEKNIYCIGAK